MHIIDPGHIYELDGDGFDIPSQTLTFVKRSGGAITYEHEWPGLTTQSVNRAIIAQIKGYQEGHGQDETYALWQLGTSETHPLILGGASHLIDCIAVLQDRSAYLNTIIPCIETGDALGWFDMAQHYIAYAVRDHGESYTIALDYMRCALFTYEARAFRRKRDAVNRKQPCHDDTESPKPWRELVYRDVPFSADDIEDIPIGDDGHLILQSS